jgi:hypothetical protein
LIGRLADEGETLQLVNNSDRVVDELDYTDDYPWPVGADGAGATLAKQTRDLSTSLPANWTVSRQLRGTPGAVNFPEAGQLPVTSSIVPIDATWSYHDRAIDLQTAWRESLYDDSSWSTGAAFFFAGNAGPSIQSPMDISGLVLWLDADATHVTKDASNRVSAWNDATGTSNNTVAQNVKPSTGARRPVWIPDAINSRPALRFDGRDDLLNNTLDNLLVPNADRTIGVVGEADDGGEGGSLVTLRRDGQ